jgi:hypothetical protein
MDYGRTNPAVAKEQQAKLKKRILETINAGSSGRCFLPSWCRYVAWGLCLILTLGCATVTTLYGFQFGRMKSLMWLQSLFFSFIQCAFITHPFLILLVSFYTAVRHRNDLGVFDHHDDGILDERIESPPSTPIEPGQLQEREFDLTEGIAARQRSRYLRFARPPQEKHLIEARKKTILEKKVTSICTETVGLAILFFLLLVVAFCKDTTRHFQLNKAMETMFVKDGPAPFGSISSLSDFWRWSKSDLLDRVTWDNWRDGDVASNHHGYVGNSVLIGRVSLRQLRVEEEPCMLPSRYANLFPSCRYGYGSDNVNKNTYGGRNLTWRYVDSGESPSEGTQGRHGYYDPSGYQVFLERNREKAYDQLIALQDAVWVDKLTRGVVVEFVVFHAPSNLFTSVKLLLEATPIGKVFPSSQIVSTHLFKYTTHYDNFVLVCELLLIVVAMFRLHIEIDDFLCLRKDYIRNPWNCIQVGMLSLLLTYIVCYIYRFVIVGELVELLRSTYHEEFLDVSFVAFWDQMLKSLLGFVLFTVLIQSLRLLRNNPVFAKLGGVYRQAAYEIVAFACIFGVWVCAYTSLGVALYASVTFDFSQWDLGLQAVTTLLTGHYALQQIELYDPTGARLYVVSFLILAVGSLTSYMFAVLSYHYKVYRKRGMTSLSTVQAARIFWTRFLFLSGLRKPPRPEQDDNILPPEFTMAEIEYQVEEMLFKMNTLAGTCGLPDKPLMYYTDSDCTYGPSGSGEDAISSTGGSEIRVFDDEKLETRIHKIEDNLFSHEPHLAALLQLDAIGADVLTQDKEKILRSQLEMEIFRQLQVQRPDQRRFPHAQLIPPHRTESFRGNLPMLAHLASLTMGSPGESPSSSGPRQSSSQSGGSVGVSSSGSQGSSEGSPASGNNQRRLKKITFPIKPPQFAGLLPRSDARKPPDVRPKTGKQKGPSTSSKTQQQQRGSDGINKNSPSSSSQSSPRERDSLAKSKSISMSEGLVLQERPARGATCEQDAIPLQDLETPATTAGSQTNLQSGSKFSSETQLLDEPASGGSNTSGGKEVHYVFDTSLSPISTVTEGLAKIGKTRDKTHYECLYDSSSGTELEAAKSAKAKSLRKTKSRGKGKGPLRVKTPVDGLDELGIDNQAFTSESDGEKKTKKKAGPKPS